MNNINDFFRYAPDALRAGVEVDQLAKILASQLRDGEAKEDRPHYDESSQKEGNTE